MSSNGRSRDSSQRDLIAMKRKHTRNFDLNADISKAVDRLQANIRTFGGKFDRLQTFALSETDARSLICLAFYEEILPVQLLLRSRWGQAGARPGGACA